MWFVSSLLVSFHSIFKISSLAPKLEQISSHTDERTSSRPGKSHLTDRSSGLVRANTHAEELLRVVSWVLIPGGVGVDRGFKEGSPFLKSLLLIFFFFFSFCSCILIALTSALLRARANHKIPTLEPLIKPISYKKSF